MATFYEWYCIERPPGRKEKRRKLRWRMTAPHAITWAEANPGKILEMVPGSGEERGEETGPYLGWGHAGLAPDAAMVGRLPRTPGADDDLETR